MWVAHYASGLVAKTFAPRVPLAILALAGALPDTVFFLLQFVGIETFNFDSYIAKHKKGCFPYTNDYPYSHSLLGMAVSGAVLALLYRMLVRVPVTPLDMAVIMATSASHFLLEWPAHREDTKITPHDDTAFGAGLFDYPTVNFFAEIAIFFLGLWVYTNFSPPNVQRGHKRNPNLIKYISAFMIAQQAQFCFASAPTSETRWVHAPLFLTMILGSCWFLGTLDGQNRLVSVGIQTPDARNAAK